MVLQPEAQFLDQWAAAQLTNGAAQIGWLAADAGLDFVELRDAQGCSTLNT